MRLLGLNANLATRRFGDMSIGDADLAMSDLDELEAFLSAFANDFAWTRHDPEQPRREARKAAQAIATLREKIGRMRESADINAEICREVMTERDEALSRALSAEAELARIEEETIERAARVADGHAEDHLRYRDDRGAAVAQSIAHFIRVRLKALTEESGLHRTSEATERSSEAE